MTRFVHAAAAAALTLLLAACGGGKSSTPLPIDEAAPQAYTLAYLKSHPEGVIQPEHLLIVPIDPNGPAGGRESVEVHVAEHRDITLAIASGESTLARIAIVDANGLEVLGHARGEDAAVATLHPGRHHIVFTPVAAVAGGKAATVFLKLAETPPQAQARQRPQALPSKRAALLAATSAAQPTALGVASVACNYCRFINADLSNQNFSGQNLDDAYFSNVALNQTNFSGANCANCQILDFTGEYINFRDAMLYNSTLQPASSISFASFNGAELSAATLSGGYIACQFGLSTTTGAHTRFRGSDLSQAVLLAGSSPMLQYVDFTNALLAPGTIASSIQNKSNNQTLVGATFDNVRPNNVFPAGFFKGMDLTGASFTNVDLSHADLSVANGVKLSSTTNLAGAILSDGLSGVNLAGQKDAFTAPYTGWAGTEGDPSTGKDLRFVDLSNVNLSRADLVHANLSGANLVGANLSLANLYGAKLNGARLGVAPGSGTQAAADLSTAYMPHADFSDADLRSVSLQNAHLYGADGTPVQFARARLDSTSFAMALLMDTDFSQASMNDTDFSGAALVNARFSGATMVNTKFTGAVLLGADFGALASMSGARFNNALMIGQPAPDNFYPFKENDGIVTDFAYKDVVLGSIATAGDSVCPDGTDGPCTGDKLKAATAPAYPVASVCVATRAYCFHQCDPGWVKPATPPPQPCR